MSDLYSQQSVRLEDYVRSFTPLPDQIGAVFAMDGEIIGLELFDSVTTFAKLFQKIIRSYGLDALSSRRGEAGGAPVPSKAQVADFLKSVADAKVSAFAGVGEGEDLRLEGSFISVRSGCPAFAAKFTTSDDHREMGAFNEGPLSV
jgi:hypothetical protein